MKNRRAFTLVELLVVIGIIALLVTIAMPTLTRAMVMARRASCATQIRGALTGMVQYATANDNRFPTCGFGPNTTRFDVIGADVKDDEDDADSNSRNLFLPLRTEYVDPGLMICPAVHDAEVPELLLGGQTLYDFNVGVDTDNDGTPDYVEKVSYSFHLQFKSRDGGPRGWPLLQTSHPEMPVLADKNPHVTYPGDAVSGGFQAETIAVGPDPNSPNHRYHGTNEGQNVGYPDGHVDWNSDPRAGPDGDNIYTVWNGNDKANGVISPGAMPQDRTDSFLVP